MLEGITGIINNLSNIFWESWAVSFSEHFRE
jgi:hypothetical protein